VTRASEDRERSMAHDIVGTIESWKAYGIWLRLLHPEIWPEVQQMIRKLNLDPTLDLRGVLEEMGAK
jgi:hypothetical protein